LISEFKLEINLPSSNHVLMPISPPPRGIESADPFTPGVVQATSYDVGRVAKVPTIRVKSIATAFARNNIADYSCELAN
jgi:hypothetical protein